VNGANVYWADEDDGTVLALPTGGGTPATLASGQALPAHVALSATGLYWVDYGTCAPVDDAGDLGCFGSVMTVPLDGGAVATLASGLTSPNRIAVDPAGVYVTSGAAGTVLKLPYDGGAPFTLAVAQGDTEGIAVDSTSVYFTDYTGRVVKLSPK
jgi:sugar lactone lactonase YvrE